MIIQIKNSDKNLGIQCALSNIDPFRFCASRCFIVKISVSIEGMLSKFFVDYVQMAESQVVPSKQI